jgi:signal transduction histidine kinase/pSer/pThr/pTyr-binding forkhead associated (FHA) protein
MSDAPPSVYATLSYLDSQGLQRTVRINRPVFSIGRLRTNDLQINNSYVSRRHAEIIYQGGTFILRDNNSTGGVLVNGARVTTHVLRSGDRFQLGDVHPVVFLFEIHPSPLDSSGLNRADEEQRTTDRLTTIISGPRSRFVNTALLDSAENITAFTLNRLKSLNEFSRKMLVTSSVQSLLECLLDAAMETLPAERGVVLLWNPTTGTLEKRAAQNRSGDLEVQPSLTIALQSFEQNVAIRSFDASLDNRLEQTPSITQQAIHSVMCAPIASAKKVWGVCYVDNLLAKTQFSDEELEYFLALTQQAGLVLDNLHLIEELRVTQERLINQEKLATLGQFASGIAHELKNQLSALTAAEILMSNTEDQGQRRLIQLILNAQQRMVAMVNEIRDFARPDAKKYEKTVQPLVAVVEEALHFARYDPLVKLCRTTFQARAHPYVNLNRDKIMQVLLNLLRNGAQAMQGKPGELTVVVDEANGSARIIVSDTGCGIAPEHLPRIWEPFFTTKGSEGTGLGLGICRRIIEGHEGDITCQSTLGQGTTFTICLPLAVPPASPPST